MAADFLKPADQLKLSRLLSRLDRLGPDDPLPSIENGKPVGSALRIGVTGPLGAGKSSLINEIIRIYRSKGLSVGIIAVDPSSPFSGGALLGDRVRMNDFTGDNCVFIRSLATRGASGGLADTAVDSADLLDQAGFERIIIETVGVGQVEVDIAGACDITLLILEPGSGDMIQTMKAGLMEIADLFVVNKKDLRGADRFISDLEMMLEMKSGLAAPTSSELAHHNLPADKTNSPAPVNRQIVLATLARTGEGVPELCDRVDDWLNSAAQNGSLQRRRIAQRRERIRRTGEAMLLKNFWRTLPENEIDRLAADGIPIRQAAKELIRQMNCR